MQFRTTFLRGRCLRLMAAMGGLWLLAIIPAGQFFGLAGVEAAGVSAVSCLLGGCLTFWVAARLVRPQLLAFAALLGTAIRGLFALIGALVMQFALELSPENYLIWLGTFYLVSLALETVLMVGPAAQTDAR